MGNWQTVPLGDVFEVQLGKMLSAGTEHGDQFPYLANRNVQWGQIVIDELGTMNFSAIERERYRLKSGDLLVCEGGEVGRAAVWSDQLPECYFQNALHRLRATPVADSGFMRHYIEFAARTGSFRALTGQTSIGHLPRSNLVRWLVPLPPLEEQRRIAEILDTIDETIQAAERVIAKLICVRRGEIDARLWSLPLNSSLGAGLERIDAGWSPACVDRSPTEREWGVLKVSSITTEEFDPSESKTLPTFLRYRPQLMVKVGDVLAARANGVADLVARTAIVDDLDHKNLMISDKTLRLVTGPTLSAPYLTYCMQHELTRCQVRGLVSGSTGQGNISQQELRSLRLPIPPLEEQLAIEQAVTTIDARIAAERNRNKKRRQLRSGLASDLLSGRVRTVPV